MSQKLNSYGQSSDKNRCHPDAPGSLNRGEPLAQKDLGIKEILRLWLRMTSLVECSPLSIGALCED